MKSLPTLVDESGRSCRLHRLLGRGGEGAVYSVHGTDADVAKVYSQTPDGRQAEKLSAMIRLTSSGLRSTTAWPAALLRDAQTGKVAGFLMPRIDDAHPIQQLYNPVQRLRQFPRAGWKFQVRTARNLVAAFEEVHRAGCLVADVNQGNALVSAAAQVHLIDCDSFQITAGNKLYPCDVGVEHYTPPELQGRPLRGVARTANHDAFGLAVLIYQLLFVGRHPYAGIFRGSGDPSFQQLIAEYRFAQGPKAPSWGMAPPPHTPTFADIPSALGRLFRRAFERGGERDGRPRPDEWIAGLEQLELEIVACAVDAGHTYWRGAGSCVWCRLAQRGGPEYYFGVADGSAVFAVDEVKLREIERRLNACDAHQFRFERQDFSPPSRVAGRPLPLEATEQGMTGFALLVAVVLCLVAIPFGLVHGAICVGGIIGAVAFGCWLSLHLVLSPWFREYRRRYAARVAAQDNLVRAKGEWLDFEEECARDLEIRADPIRRAITECRSLTTQFHHDLKRLVSDAEAAARTRHLQLHSLADADIPKIGAVRKQLLADNGVCTAADIDEKRIRSIRGFGSTLTGALLRWKSEVLRTFQFTPAAAVSPAQKSVVAAALNLRQRHLLAETGRRCAELEAVVMQFHARAARLREQVRQAVANRQQAESDFEVMHRR